jgi:hypothetical protein
MARTRLAAAVLLLGIAAAAAAAEGTTIYVTRIVAADPGSVALGDLVRVSGPVGAAAQEALAQGVAAAGAGLLYVPTDAYRARLDAAFGADAIVVGSRSMVVPRGSALETQAGFLDKLADWLTAQGLVGNAPTEILVSSLSVRGTPPADGTPSFQVHAGTSGGTEVSFSLLGLTGGSMVGRLSISGSALPLALSSGVKSGTPVSVVFRKGVITIEMPGKATGSAAVGQKVGVSIAESQRAFTGTVMDGKAVQVDLP